MDTMHGARLDSCRTIPVVHVQACEKECRGGESATLKCLLTGATMRHVCVSVHRLAIKSVEGTHLQSCACLQLLRCTTSVCLRRLAIKRVEGARFQPCASLQL